MRLVDFCQNQTVPAHLGCSRSILGLSLFVHYMSTVCVDSIERCTKVYMGVLLPFFSVVDNIHSRDFLLDPFCLTRPAQLCKQSRSRLDYGSCDSPLKALHADTTSSEYSLGKDTFLRSRLAAGLTKLHLPYNPEEILTGQVIFQMESDSEAESV